MQPFSANLITALHSAPAQWVLAMTGGGASVAGDLLSRPGGSRTLLEIIVPYHDQALAEFLGYRPKSYCNDDTSQAMARRALDRAAWLKPGAAVFGLGCTASLVSDRPKRGDHRLHVSIAGHEQIRTWSLILKKGARDRPGEESLAGALILQAMAQTLGLPILEPVPLLTEEQITENVNKINAGPIDLEKAEALLIEADGQFSPTVWSAGHPQVLVPGAFNPLHRAHMALAALAQKLEDKPVAFELSVTNVDKPVLTHAEVRRRLEQFALRAPVWLTRAPRFLDKARLFPGATFAIGADTAFRLIATRYYLDNEQHLARAFAYLRQQGCRFLVAGRIDGEGRYLGLEDIAIPAEYRDLFRAISRDKFRMDISSSVLRQGCR